MVEESAMTAKYGARVYFHDDGVILIKQTVLRDGKYVIDCDENGGHKEEFADPSPGAADRVFSILLEAKDGKLQSSGMGGRETQGRGEAS